YRHVSFPGPMSMQFGSYQEAVELTEIFFPKAAGEVRRRGQRSVPFDVLGINPPRDLAVKVVGGLRSRAWPRWGRACGSRSAAARRRSCPTWPAAWPTGDTTCTFTPPPGRRSRGSR